MDHIDAARRGLKTALERALEVYAEEPNAASTLLWAIDNYVSARLDDLREQIERSQIIS